MFITTSIILTLVSVSNCSPQNAEASTKSDIEDRIQGGSVATLQDLSYQVALVMSYGLSTLYWCGASMVSEKHVLTAAHCIEMFNVTSYLSAKPSLQGRYGSLAWRTGKQIRFESHAIHPRYDGIMIKYDIGVLTVQGKIQFTDQIKPVPISYDHVNPGDQLLLTGWGRTASAEEGSPVLKLLHLKAVGHEECTKMHQKIEIDLPVNDEIEICGFHSYGNGACKGDSGGALLKNGQQVGIVSWGAPCAHGVPDVYSRISGLKDFLLPIIGAK